ncbi:2-acylglycerol O-acyltransferase 2-like [Anneissia japonica]|uniref:2-acylglycerol O-acyltransferase 2-like n=1 Tax=Anneissia japonica TaxID=1529436 RepID=UPI001425A22C|nr:2-acylglycerol O-acyltransferase 2-like [Anneissia japonica]XP_033127080.1 2-acylglycerol O-acyltransferase 2-like [Anneissia japonica]
MKLLGIELAPLAIPFRRRLQTFCVFQWFMSFLFLGFGMLFLTFYIVLYTNYYWIPILLYSWTWYDRATPQRGGRRSEFVRNLSIWKGLADFFPMKLHKVVDLDPSKNYVCGFHPHGVFAVGAFANFASEGTGFSKLFPGLKSTLLTLRGQFFFPVYRDYIMLSGVCDASRESVDYLLKENGTGNMVVIVIGGAIEVLEAHPGIYNIYLKKRKGFVKKAIETGTHIIPVYSFGETDIFYQVANPEGSLWKWIQRQSKKLMGFPLIAFYGRGVFNYTLGLVPHRRPINTVVGHPIEVEKIEHPTQEDIDKLHETYCKQLQQLFEDYKCQFGIPEDNHLDIL